MEELLLQYRTYCIKSDQSISVLYTDSGHYTTVFRYDPRGKGKQIPSRYDAYTVPYTESVQFWKERRKIRFITVPCEYCPLNGTICCLSVWNSMGRAREAARAFLTMLLRETASDPWGIRGRKCGGDVRDSRVCYSNSFCKPDRTEMHPVKRFHIRTSSIVVEYFAPL